MAEFHHLPIERCLELIDTWANAPWPVTVSQGHRIALTLGWRTTEKGPRFYAGDLSDGEMDSFFNQLNGIVIAVDFPLGTRIPLEREDELGPLIAAFYASLVRALKDKYGKPQFTKKADFERAKWPLPSGASISVINFGVGCDVTISSPDYNTLLNDPASDPNPDETDL